MYSRDISAASPEEAGSFAVRSWMAVHPTWVCVAQSESYPGAQYLPPAVKEEECRDCESGRGAYTHWVS